MKNLDLKFINFAKKHAIVFSRIALFVVYFWFGALKLFGTSPANPLVENLLQKTLPFMTFDTFIILLGIGEMIIGLAFLIKGFERLAILLLIPHMITTAMPLILLPSVAWQSFLTPTLEGQYIIKNLLIIASALFIGSNLIPRKQS
ncbi:MAG: hypothetical protein AAB787_00150 [Patescibacteria group bacterium]